VAVAHTSGHDDLILVSSEGKAIRFHEYDVRPTGRNTMGVTGMRIRQAMCSWHGGRRRRRDIFCVTKEVRKRTPVSGYPTQRRGGQGVITIKDSLTGETWSRGHSA